MPPSPAEQWNASTTRGGPPKRIGIALWGTAEVRTLAKASIRRFARQDRGDGDRTGRRLSQTHTGRPICTKGFGSLAVPSLRSAITERVTENCVFKLADEPDGPAVEVVTKVSDLLAFATNDNAAREGGVMSSVSIMVAGTGFEPVTFRL